MAQTSLIIGEENWAIKSGSLLGYNVFDDNSYSPVPIDIVRATTATRVNSSGLIKSVGIDVPRIDYSDGTASLLLEPQRTNLLSYSEQFDNNYWAKSYTTITANSVISPDGTQNADIIRNTPRFGSYIQRNTVLSATSTYTLSLYVKPLSTNKYIFFEYDYGTSGVATFNLSNQTTDGIGSRQIIPIGNGWFRISNTVTNVTRFSSMYIGGYGTTPDNTSFAIWGAQLESGSYTTSYIPTVASTVTRNGDVVSKTGISTLIGQTEGTVFVDYIWNNNDIDVIPISIIGDLGKLILIRKNGVQFYTNGTSLIFNAWTNPIQNNRYKLAFVYGQNYFKLFINGVLISQLLTGTFSGNFSQIIFNEYAGQSPFDSSIKHKSFQLYKTKLSDAECIALTTL
jgi:hypothetical protein